MKPPKTRCNLTGIFRMVRIKPLGPREYGEIQTSEVFKTSEILVVDMFKWGHRMGCRAHLPESNPEYPEYPC
jgi:hypothetical protein